MNREDEISYFNMDFNKANQAVNNAISSLNKARDEAKKHKEALQLISEMPCVPDNCASCYAKKVLEGGE